MLSRQHIIVCHLKVFWLAEYYFLWMKYSTWINKIWPIPLSYKNMHHDQTKSLPSKSFCFIFHICILVPPRTCIIINKNLTVFKESLHEIHLFNCWKIATSRLNKFEALSFNDKKVIGISKLKESYCS